MRDNWDVAELSHGDWIKRCCINIVDQYGILFKANIPGCQHRNQLRVWVSHRHVWKRDTPTCKRQVPVNCRLWWHFSANSSFMTKAAKLGHLAPLHSFVSEWATDTNKSEHKGTKWHSFITRLLQQKHWRQLGLNPWRFAKITVGLIVYHQQAIEWR